MNIKEGFKIYYKSNANEKLSFITTIGYALLPILISIPVASVAVMFWTDKSVEFASYSHLGLLTLTSFLPAFLIVLFTIFKINDFKNNSKPNYTLQFIGYFNLMIISAILYATIVIAKGDIYDNNVLIIQLVAMPTLVYFFMSLLAYMFIQLKVNIKYIYLIISVVSVVIYVMGILFYIKIPSNKDDLNTYNMIVSFVPLLNAQSMFSILGCDTYVVIANICMSIVYLLLLTTLNIIFAIKNKTKTEDNVETDFTTKTIA